MYLESSTPGLINEAISSMSPEEEELVVIFLAEDDAPDLQELVTCLNNSGISFMGGIFPGLINGRKLCNKGCIIQKYPAVSELFKIEPISADKIIYPKDLTNMIDDLPEGGYTALVLLDGLSENISSLLYGLFNHLGNSVNYLGGGAGSLNNNDMPCMFSNEGVFSNAAFIVIIKKRSGLGVAHGWQRAGGPVIATHTNGNTVNKLNWEPAFGVYRSIVDNIQGEKLTMENFFDVSKGHPFGIMKEGAEDIVRDPISAEPDGSIRCVGEIPENAVLNVLEGKPEDLVKSAGKAASDSIGNLDATEGTCLVFDCISRVLYLGDRVEEELSEVVDVIDIKIPGRSPEGVFSIGEISSTGEGLLEFFNKTIVVGFLYE